MQAVRRALATSRFTCTPARVSCTPSMRKLMSVGAILSSPVIVDDVVYFGSTDGNLYALN
jgi:outer membrane protein assembly factor BamB